MKCMIGAILIVALLNAIKQTVHNAFFTCDSQRRLKRTLSSSLILILGT